MIVRFVFKVLRVMQEQVGTRYFLYLAHKVITAQEYRIQVLPSILRGITMARTLVNSPPLQHNFHVQLERIQTVQV
jgi:hypothetical protein